MTHMERTLTTYLVNRRRAERLMESAPKELVRGKQKGRYLEMLQEARQHSLLADAAFLELEQQLQSLEG